MLVCEGNLTEISFGFASLISCLRLDTTFWNPLAADACCDYGSCRDWEVVCEPSFESPYAIQRSLGVAFSAVFEFYAINIESLPWTKLSDFNEVNLSRAFGDKESVCKLFCEFCLAIIDCRCCITDYY